MAQTTGGVAYGCGKLEISTDGSAWTDISGQVVSVTGNEQTRMSGEGYTLSGDGPIIKGGKLEPVETVVKLIYTETDAEAYEQARAVFETSACQTDFYLMISPRGGSADDEELQTAAGVLVSFLYPDMDASTGGVIPAGFTLKHSGFTTTIVAS